MHDSDDRRPDLQKLGAKLYLAQGGELSLHAFVPAFHRWIREHVLPGTLIDVVDYSHVHQGPGIMLVSLEWHLSVDEEGGRRGLAIDYKRPLGGTSRERVRTALRTLVEACVALESEPSLAGKVRFRGEEILLRASDRALAPNDDGSWPGFSDDLDAVSSWLYPSSRCEVSRIADRRRPLGATLRAPAPVDVATLLQRLS